MSDVSSISAAGLVHKTSRASTQASPSSANREAEQGGKLLPPDAVSTKPVTPEVQSQSQESVQESVQSAVAKMNEYVQSTQRDLQFSYDEASGDTIVKVLDRETQEVVRQIPDEIFLKLARSLSVDEPVQLFTGQA